MWTARSCLKCLCSLVRVWMRYTYKVTPKGARIWKQAGLTARPHPRATFHLRTPSRSRPPWSAAATTEEVCPSAAAVSRAVSANPRDCLGRKRRGAHRGSVIEAGCSSVALVLFAAAGMEDFSAKFVSQKISKTRWRPVPAAALQPPELFATGSWDNEENKISVWSVGDFGSLGPNEEYQGEPQLLCDIRHHGDVMDMQFFDQERIVAAIISRKCNHFRHHQNSGK
uniref:Uncharacterized protein n=1 Tax=Gopherus evgoodei TaxID=1825980 RepID=A0A8C4WLP3_9SAUR